MTPFTTTHPTSRARGSASAGVALACSALVLLGACGRRGDENEASAPFSRGAMSDSAAARERSVRARVAGDTTSEPVRVPITVAGVNAPPTRMPIPAVDEGPEILAVQVMLDRSRFSTGALDGIWGENTRKAVQWFQRAHHLDTTGIVDETTLGRLRESAGEGALVGSYRVTADDVEGPFTPIPSDVYDQARLDCLCYRSPREMLAERFHAAPELLDALNPGVDLSRPAAGTTIAVPAVRPFLLGELETDSTIRSNIAEIVISKRHFWLQARDAEGRIVFHFPSVLGSAYDPSPTGEFAVERVAWRPPFHYQPTLFHEVPDDEPEALLPAGPNSPVGVVWMALTKPHYGIHGTSSPNSVGHTSSHGCVRLTNWDAATLGRWVAPGTPVHFVE
jgi:lipoprotein-anchoring transpeptidase ErfK/SrfK